MLRIIGHRNATIGVLVAACVSESLFVCCQQRGVLSGAPVCTSQHLHRVLAAEALFKDVGGFDRRVFVGLVHRVELLDHVAGLYLG